MATLVCNGSLLYRRAGSLVRDPVPSRQSITLNPVERAYYAVAGRYLDGFPITGILHNTALTAGKTMRRSALFSSLLPSRPTNQRWRQVTTSHDPEFVFYQGEYNPSQTVDAPFGSCEAYMQLAAYRFSIPSEYAGKQVYGATLSVIHGGTIFQHESPKNHFCELTVPTCFVADAPFSLCPKDSNWRTPWNMHIGVFDRLNDEPWSMVGNYQMEADFNTHTKQGSVNTRDFSSSRQIWWSSGIPYQSGRGYIPVSTAPWVQNIILNQACVNSINSLRGGWIVVLPNVGYSNFDDRDTSEDYPMFTPGDDFGQFWLCCSFWGFGLQLTIAK